MRMSCLAGHLKNLPIIFPRRVSHLRYMTPLKRPRCATNRSCKTQGSLCPFKTTPSLCSIQRRSCRVSFSGERNTEARTSDGHVAGRRAALVVARCRSHRQQYLAKLGTLQSNLVKRTTEHRYAKWFELFVLLLQQELGYLPATAPDYDMWLGRYIEFLWQEGEPKSAASVTLAAVQQFVPSLKKNLPWSWRLKSKWDSLELPCQASPLTSSLLFALMEQAFEWGWERLAYLMLLMFLGFLRNYWPGFSLALQACCYHC